MVNYINRADADGTVYQFNPGDMSVVNSFSTGFSVPQQSGVYTNTAGEIYVGNNDVNGITKFDNTGSEIWTSSDPGREDVRDILEVPSEGVVICVFGIEVAALDASTGSQIWSSFAISGTANACTWDPQRRQVIVGGKRGSSIGDPNLIGLNVDNGNTVWFQNLGGDNRVDTITTVYNSSEDRYDTVYHRSDNGTLERVHWSDDFTRFEVWTAQHTYSNGASDFGSSGKRDDSGFWYLGLGSQAAEKVDMSNGQIMWTEFPGTDSIGQPPALEPNPNGFSYGSWRESSVYKLAGDGSTDASGTAGEYGQITGYPDITTEPSAWVAGPEEITASQTTTVADMLTASAVVPLTQVNAGQYVTGASMNSAQSVLTVFTSATPTVSTTSPSAGVVSMSQPAGQVAGSATMNAIPALDESLLSAQFESVATSNDGNITSLSTDATQSPVTATMLSPDADGITFITSTQPTVSASQNDGFVALFLDSAQVESVGAMNTPVLTVEYLAVQPKTDATMGSGDLRFTQFINASPARVRGRNLSATTIFNPFLDAEQFTVQTESFTATIGVQVIRRFGDLNSSIVGQTANNSDIEATVNEVE